MAWAGQPESQGDPLGGFSTPDDSGSGEVNQLTTIAPSESEGIHKKWTFAFTQSIGLAGSGRRQPAAGGWTQITGVEASAEQTCGIGPRIDDDFKIELGSLGFSSDEHLRQEEGCHAR